MKKITLTLTAALMIAILFIGAIAEEGAPIELDPMYNVPTEELLQRFPIAYQTPANTDMEKKIQNRMLNGFNTWNLGYEAWENWGQVLYSDASIYNVHGAHLTLPEYQMAMNMSLQATDIQMGQFRNMILVGDWTAIRYDTTMTNRQTGETSASSVTEFVHFADFGELGAKVDEGWGGVRNADIAGMMYFMTEDEQAYQKELDDAILSIELQDTDDLEEKYPITYPTEISADVGLAMKAAILSDFDAWNSGTDAWGASVDGFFAADAAYYVNDVKMTMEEAKAEAAREINDLKVQRVRIDNILISEDWAAIHYWNVIASEDGTRMPMDTMTFMHFFNTDDGVKADMCWVYQGF